jgi:hypothetical protein
MKIINKLISLINNEKTRGKKEIRRVLVRYENL